MSAVLRGPDASGAVPLRHRPMVVADVGTVLAIEVQAYSHPWSRGNFVDSLVAGYETELRLTERDALVGYCVALVGVEETHLLNLTVAPAHQRRGHGLALLERLAARARARGDRHLWLEVRESNAGARALYRRHGFVEVGLRRGYYPAERSQREHAVVMSLALQPGGTDALG